MPFDESLEFLRTLQEQIDQPPLEPCFPSVPDDRGAPSKSDVKLRIAVIATCHCGQRSQVPKSLFGHSMNCPSCTNEFHVPDLEIHSKR